MLMPLLSLALAALSLGFAVDAHMAGHHHPRRHHELARRASSDIQLHLNARWTFYDVGLGACGKWSHPGDYMVALNAVQFGFGFPGPKCFKSITMRYGGQSVNAIVMDRCIGCPFGGLDLSPGLFEAFASKSEGVIYGTWFFNDGWGGGGGDGGGGGGGDDDDAPRPTYTHTHTHTPIWTPPPPPPSIPWTPPTALTPSTTAEIKAASTWKPVVTSSSSSSSSTSPTNALVHPTNGVPSGPTIPTGSGTKNVTKPQNIYRLNTSFINLGRFIVSTRSTT
ncbi:hypothetical protein APHAL10511_007038 [Amanita phalloides]|nr:hypothetical protein APHAL10511_007038 [Amanita phalloides]